MAETVDSSVFSEVPTFYYKSLHCNHIDPKHFTESQDLVDQNFAQDHNATWKEKASKLLNALSIQCANE